MNRNLPDYKFFSELKNVMEKYHAQIVVENGDINFAIRDKDIKTRRERLKPYEVGYLIEELYKIEAEKPKKRTSGICDDYRNFINELEIVREDIGTLLFVFKKHEDPLYTVAEMIECYEDVADRLKNALNDLKTKEGRTLMRDIPL